MAGCAAPFFAGNRGVTMGKITVTKCPLDGLYIIKPAVYGDDRGYFMETYNQMDMQAAGLAMAFVQDNQSMSKKGVLRGMHIQKQYPQGKLVRVLKGRVFDVALDLRRDSETFGRWYGVELSENNKKQFYLPEGFAHGFLVLSDIAEFLYKCTDYYHPEDETGVLWNDPDVNIAWPLEGIEDIILSKKDRQLPLLKALKDEDLPWRRK
jgi:dTDP-4-dehydrorhamnose 3,5-epimerase